MTLGERIVELRNTRRLSQMDLAEAMDVSRQSVSKWETGASVPDLEKLVKLADYFDLSLDQLVKGKDPCAQPGPAKDMGPEASRPAPQRTKAQSLGIFLVCLSAFASILFAIFFGLWGILFAAPVLLFGLICYFVKNHPILKAVWTDYILLSLYFHYCTGIQPSNIWLTFRWTYEMNYAILVFSWIWFLLMMALIIGTAFVLRNKGWSWSSPCISELIFGLALFALSFILRVFANHAYWLYLLTSYLQLAGFAVLLTDFTRWAVHRKESGTNNRCS